MARCLVSRSWSEPALACVAAAALLGALPAGAEPLSLAMSHTLTHDNNFARTETPIGNTVNATSLALKLDKPYGRQTYTGQAKITALRYGQFGDILNNEAKDVSLGFGSEVASNWDVQLNGAYGQTLNKFEYNTQGNRISRNVRTLKSADAQVTYGRAGLWAIVGSGGKNVVDYSQAAYFYQNLRQDHYGLKAVYYSTDLLSYSVGLRQFESSYPNSGYLIREHDADVGVNWVVSGLSQLNATLSWTRNRYVVPNDRNFNGATGYLNWNYTPHGVMSYGVSVYKTSNSNQFDLKYWVPDMDMGVLRLNTVQQINNNRITSANLHAKWAASAKVSVTGSASWNHYTVEQSVASQAVNDSSDLRSVSLTAYYNFDRWLALSAGASRYQQTKDITRNAYKGTALHMAATLTLD